MISLILVTLAFIFKAGMDLSADGKLKIGKPRFWIKSESAPNKWKHFWSLDKILHYIPGPDGSKVEAFWGSSRCFVFLTDGWHLMQFFFLNLMIAAVIFYHPMVNAFVDLFLMSVASRVVFELCYTAGEK